MKEEPLSEEDLRALQKDRQKKDNHNMSKHIFFSFFQINDFNTRQLILFWVKTNLLKYTVGCSHHIKVVVRSIDGVPEARPVLHSSTKVKDCKSFSSTSINSDEK